MIGFMKRFFKIIGIIVVSIIAVLLLVWFLLNWSLRPRTTKFEDCFPPVTLVATESVPTVQIYRLTEGQTSFSLGIGDYRVCLARSGTTCSDTWQGDFEFVTLPVGTEIMLDGFAVEHTVPLVRKSTYFRGAINSQIAWVLYRDAGLFTDRANENSFRLMGMIDDSGQRIYENQWKCTQ